MFDNSIIHLFVDMVAAIATVCGAFLAYLAWCQSLRTRHYTSFETSFSNMIALQKSFFHNEFLRTTELNHTIVVKNIAFIFLRFRGKTHMYLIDTHLPIAINFSIFLSKIRNDFPNEAFSHQDLVYIWDNYTNRLVYRSHFLNSFKFLYNIINTITVSNIAQVDKSKYVERVQSLMNQDELFCYYINQIVYSNESDSQYLKILRTYDFFRDVITADKFAGIMKNISLSDKRLLKGCSVEDNI